MINQRNLAALCMAFAMTISAASAASISAVDFDAGDYAARVSAGEFFGENFESEGNAAGEGEVGPSLVTDIGTFSALGGTGTGGTVRNLSGNTGTQLALRDGNTYGRRDAVGGRWYLDSNDTYGIGWQVSSTRMFDTVMFIVTDGSDRGGFLRIVADGMSFEQRTDGRLRDGTAQLITIDFGQRVSSAYIELANYRSDGTTLRTNDGFSIDGAQVGLAAVPVPPAGILLAAGIGGLMVLRRRRASAA